MNLISIGKSVFKKRSDGIDVILCHLSNVLKEEGHGLDHTVLNIQFGNSIFVHQCRQNGEWCTSLGDDTNCNCCADSALTFLDTQIVQESCQNIAWTDSFGNVTEGVVGSATNSLAMGFEHVKQLEADPHPLPSIDTLRASVGNATNEIDGIL